MIEMVAGHQALLIKNGVAPVLVVADFHIGFEKELAALKVNIPSQTPKLQTRLMSILKEVNPHRLIFLGDVKHSVPKIDVKEWEDVPAFFEKIQKFVNEIEVIPGNHDGNLEALIPRTVKILPSKGIIVEDGEKILLFHGHTWPPPELLDADCLVMAHNHPVLHFVDPVGFRFIEQVWISSRVDGEKLASALLRHLNMKTADPVKTIEEKFGTKIRNPKLIIMPSFNEILGGLPVNMEKPENLLGPVLQSGAVNINDAEAYMLDGTFIGRIEYLRKYAFRRKYPG